MSDSTREFDPNDNTPHWTQKWTPVFIPLFILALGACVYVSIIQPHG